jgi:hypothetical protein
MPLSPVALNVQPESGARKRMDAGEPQTFGDAEELLNGETSSQWSQSADGPTGESNPRAQASAILEQLAPGAIEQELRSRAATLPDEDLRAFWGVLSSTAFTTIGGGTQQQDPTVGVHRIVSAGKAAIAAAAQGELGRTKTDVCVECLQRQLPRLPGWALAELVAAVLATVSAGTEGKQLELLPHLLEATSRLDSFHVARDGSGLSVTGENRGSG